MSREPGADAGPGAAAEVPAEAEVVDGVPVLAAEARAIEPVRAAGPLAVQAAAVAAGGFVAGAAAAVVVHRRRVRKAAKKNGKRGRRKGRDLAQVVASRSFLVDVHLLGRD